MEEKFNEFTDSFSHFIVEEFEKYSAEESKFIVEKLKDETLGEAIEKIINQ